MKRTGKAHPWASGSCTRMTERGWARAAPHGISEAANSPGPVHSARIAGPSPTISSSQLTCSRLHVPQSWCAARANTFASATQCATSLASYCKTGRGGGGSSWPGCCICPSTTPHEERLPTHHHRTRIPAYGHCRRGCCGASIVACSAAACCEIVPYEERSLLRVGVACIITVKACIPAKDNCEAMKR